MNNIGTSNSFKQNTKIKTPEFDDDFLLELKVAMQTSSEVIKILEKEREISPLILNIPLDAAWLNTLDSKKRDEILKNRQQLNY